MAGANLIKNPLRRLLQPFGKDFAGFKNIDRAWMRRFFFSGAFVALLVFFAKSAMSALPRLISAYYPLLVPALLTSPVHAILVRKMWWRRLAFGLTLLAIPVVVLTPARPLWPANYCLARTPPNSGRLWQRVKEVYTLYNGRSDALAPIRALLPPDCTVVGFLGTEDDSSVSLWEPLGSRRVEYLKYRDPREQVLSRGIRVLVIDSLLLRHNASSIEGWLQWYNAETLGSAVITQKLGEGPQRWYLVKLSLWQRIAEHAELSAPEVNNSYTNKPSI